MDSNHRRRKPADLQSAPFGHFGIYPFPVKGDVLNRAVRAAQGFRRKKCSSKIFGGGPRKGAEGAKN